VANGRSFPEAAEQPESCQSHDSSGGGINLQEVQQKLHAVILAAGSAQRKTDAGERPLPVVERAECKRKAARIGKLLNKLRSL